MEDEDGRNNEENETSPPISNEETTSPKPAFLTENRETSSLSQPDTEQVLENCLEESEPNDGVEERNHSPFHDDKSEKSVASKDEDYETDLEVDEEEWLNPDKADFDTSGKNQYMKVCGETGVTPISYYMKHLKDKEMRMKFHGLGPDVMKTLCVPLEGNTFIEKINLQGNGIDSSGAEELCNFLKENVYVTEMTLSENKLGNGGTLSICELLHVNRIIRSIDLSGNEIDDSVAEEIHDMLMSNNSIKRVHLGHNKFEEGGAYWFREILSDNESLEELDLQWNRFNSRSSLMLLEGLEENVGLKVLNIKGSGLGLSGGEALGRALKANRTLREIDVSFTRIPIEATKTIAAGLAENDILEHLKIGCNPYGAAGAIVLLQSVEKNDSSSLAILDLSNITVTRDFQDLELKLLKEKDLKVFYEDVLPDFPVFEKRKKQRDIRDSDDPTVSLKILLQDFDVTRETFEKEKLDSKLGLMEFIKSVKKCEKRVPIEILVKLLNSIQKDGLVDCSTTIPHQNEILREEEDQR